MPKVLAAVAEQAPESVELTMGAVLGAVGLNALRQVWANGAPANLRGTILIPDAAALVGALVLGATETGKRYPTAVLGATAVAGAAVVDGILNLFGFDLI